jgi:hypothetical protein
MEQTKIDKILENISKKGNVSIDAVKTVYSELSFGVPTDDDSVIQVLQEVQKKFGGGSKAKPYQMIFFGFKQLGDYNRKIIKDAKAAYAKDARESMENGIVELVDGKVVVIDRKQFFDKDQKMANPNVGKELLPSYVCGTIALVKNAEGNFVYTPVELRGKCAKGAIPEQGKIVETTMLGDFTKGFHTVDSSVFSTIGDVDNINGIMAEAFKDHVIPIEDIFDDAFVWHEKKPAKGTPDTHGYYDRFIITNATQKFINPPKEEGNNYNGVINDLMIPYDISCFVDPRCKTPEKDKGYTYIGQTSIKKGYDTETKSNTEDDVVVLNVMGVFS